MGEIRVKIGLLDSISAAHHWSLHILSWALSRSHPPFPLEPAEMWRAGTMELEDGRSVSIEENCGIYDVSAMHASIAQDPHPAVLHHLRNS